MGASTFHAGATIAIGGVTHSLLRKISDTQWQLEETRTKRIIEDSDAGLREKYASGALIFISDDRGRALLAGKSIGKPHREIEPMRFEEAKLRRLYALAATDVPNTKEALTRCSEELWDKIKRPTRSPHWTTVYRWKERFLAAGKDINALVEAREKRGNWSGRYPKDVLEIAEKAIDTVYLTRERKTIQDTLDHAELEVRKENNLRPADLQLPMITRRYIARLIGDLPAFDKYAARHGRTAAERRFRSVLKHRTTKAPLERAEIDHTLMDLFVIDDDSGLPLGRPWLTACADDFTRCALGIKIGFEPPSHLSVAQCLKAAFLPKVSLRAEYPDIKHDWAAHGVMRELVVDNGMEFHSESLEAACLSLGIELHYAPRRTPWFKGKIERFLGTFNRGVAHGIPGTTFSDIFEKDDYDPSKHAVVRLSTLRKIAAIWIADYYHQKPHRSLKEPPAARWESSIRPDDILVPDDPAELDAILGRLEQRVLTHKGIELDGLLYNSPELTALRYELGDRLEVELRVDDSDIGKIVVFSPDKRRRFTAEALSTEYAKGLTRWQHKVCQRFAASKLKLYDKEGWLTAKETIARLITEEMKLKRRKSLKRIQRFKGESPAPRPEQQPGPGNTAAPQSAAAGSTAPPSAIGLPTPPAQTSPPSALAPVTPKRFKAVIRERSPRST